MMILDEIKTEADGIRDHTAEAIRRHMRRPPRRAHEQPDSYAGLDFTERRIRTVVYATGPLTWENRTRELDRGALVRIAALCTLAIEAIDGD